jgi:hypothetical protein
MDIEVPLVIYEFSVPSSGAKWIAIEIDGVAKGIDVFLAVDTIGNINDRKSITAYPIVGYADESIDLPVVFDSRSGTVKKAKQYAQSSRKRVTT